MKFKTYWQNFPVADRVEFAARCKVSYSTLNQLCFGRSVSESVCLAIEKESAGAVTVGEIHAEFADLLRNAGYVRLGNDGVSRSD